MINRLENEISAMNERFGHEQIYKNPDLLACLQHDFDAKTAELERQPSSTCSTAPTNAAHNKAR